MAEEGVLGSDDAAAGGIFPFLSVLICTMGVMVFILVAGFITQSTTMGGSVKERVTVKYEHAESTLRKRVITHKSLTNRRKTIKNAVVLTQKAKKKTSNFMMEARNLGTDIEKASTDILVEEGDLKELETNEATSKENILKYGFIHKKKVGKRSLAQIEKASDAVNAARAKVVAEADALDEEVRRLRNQRASLERDLEAPEITFEFHGEGESSSPIVIDIHKDRLIVRHSPILGIEKGPRPGGLQDFSAFFESVASELATGGQKTYALLLVRPDAVEAFYQARKAFMKWRAPYKHEPFEANWNPGLVTGQQP